MGCDCCLQDIVDCKCPSGDCKRLVCPGPIDERLASLGKDPLWNISFCPTCNLHLTRCKCPVVN